LRELTCPASVPGRSATALLCAVILSLLPAFAQAQTGEPDSDWTFRVGGGALYSPAFAGSDDYQLSALPYLYVEYRDIFEASVQRGARFNLIRGGALTAGPIARVNFGRREDGDSIFRVAGRVPTTLLGMGDIDATAEFGGFLEYEIEPFTASLELRQAVSGHEGFVGRAGIMFSETYNPFGGVLIVQIEPGIRFGGETFTQSYFGVTAQQSLNTGYAPYDPDGGIYAVGIGSTVIVPLSANFFVGIVADYESLTGDARDAPFIRNFGTTDQASVGLLFAFQFGG